MKKKFLFILCALFFIIVSIEVVYAENNVELKDCTLFSEDQLEFLQYVFGAIRIATPILVVILVMKDFLQALTSQKEEDMKRAQSNAIKRIVIGVVIMFVPTLVNLVLDLLGQGINTCRINFM